jgi:uncharacterized phage infection (PIP) family protein YhgE
VKKRLWFTALIPLLIIGLLLTGCPTAKTGSSTTIQDVQDEVSAMGDAVSQNADDIADIDGRVSDLEDASSPDLSGYATDADLNNAFSSGTNIDRFLSNLTDAQITTLKEKLGLSTTSTSSTSTGKVTVEITDSINCDFEDTSLTGIYSSTASSAYYFTVTVVNNTDDYKWVYISVMLARKSIVGGTIPFNITGATLDNLTYTSSLTYAATYDTVGTDDKSVTFSPSGTAYTSFSVGKGKTAEIQYLLTLTTDKAAIWNGNLMYSVSSTP